MRLVTAGTLALLAALAAFAQDVDSDGDGIPDVAESVLGLDPATPDVLPRVHDDRSAAQGDRLAAAWRRAPDLTAFSFANVAQDRWVWRMDTADRLDLTGVRVMLYIDADNDIRTGRRDGAPGTDVRLICEGGAFSTAVSNPAVLARDRALRGYVDDHSLYFSMDLQIHHNAAGKAECRMYALSQTTTESGDADSTVWFTAVVDGRRELPKRPVGLRSQFASEGMHVQRPWLGWRAQRERLGVLTLEPRTAVLTGLSLLNAAMEPVAPGAQAAFPCPVVGTFHIQALIQDSAAGRDEVSIRVGDRRVGRIAAVDNDGDLYLFTSSQPVVLSRQDTITLEAMAPAQDFRICEVSLSPRVIEPEGLEISHLSTWVTPAALPGACQGDGVDVDVCFLTNCPVVATVRWGEGRALDREAAESVPTYNHRVRLTGLKRGGSYSLQASARLGGDAAESETLALVADARRLGRCGVERVSLALSIADGMNNRPAWPVSSGIPLPRGHLSEVSRCRLLDAAGQPVPAQFGELAYWPDGSVKWLLISFVHPGGLAAYALEYGDAVRAPAITDGIRVEATPDGLVVTTQRLRAELSSLQFAPPGRVSVDADGDGRFTDPEVVVSGRDGLVLVDGDGKRYTSAAARPARFELEEAGPVRTVVRAEGPLAGPTGAYLRYRCRLTFYRDFPGIGSEVSLLAHQGTSGFPPTLNRVRSLTWPLASALVGPAAPRRWLQHDVDRYTVTTAGASEPGEGQAAGVTSHGSAGRGVALTAVIRDFWQKYPKALAVEPGLLTAEIFPELPADIYARHTDPKLLTMNYYWFREGAYLVASGTEPTAEVLLYFGRAASASQAGEALLAEAWQQPIRLTPGPEFVCASGAFMDLAPSRPGRFETYDRYMRAGLDALQRTRERQREYSWMNYGDTYGERYVNWTNQEYDMQWGLLVNYARTGDLAYLVRGLEATAHTVEIDMINWSDDPALQGIQKEHAPWHVGGYGTPRPPDTPYWFQNGIWNTGHVWTQGTYMAWCLTGERRYYESIARSADFLATRCTQEPERWVHRNYGWLPIAALGAYHTTGDPFQLNAARFYVQNVVDRQDPGSGTLIHPIGECEHPVRHMGGKSFMTGVVMAGLTMMDQVEPRPDLERSLVLSADWLLARMWNSARNGFRYAQCPQFDDGAGTPVMECWGLARAAELSGKPEHREMFLRSLSRMIHETGASGSGKGYATQIRMTPYAVSALDRWGLTAVPPAPPTRPEMSLPADLYFVPGQTARLSVAAKYTSPTPLTVHAEVKALPAGLKAEPAAVEWRLERTGSPGPGFVLSGQARTGDVIVVHWRAGEWRGELQTTVRVHQPMTLGQGLGYVGGDDDPVGLALRTLGLRLEPLADLTPATLQHYRALLIGREAHEKNYLGIREHNAVLLDFVQAGGAVAFIQLQDSNWQAAWLPSPLALSDQSGRLQTVVDSAHSLFTTPHHLESLAGIVSYDTITKAGEAWTVLARDDRGQPSIVWMRAGRGRVLLVQPSPDRYVIGQETASAPLAGATCAALLENIVAWLQSPAE